MNHLLLHAHAKINLRLEVLGKRPDGYHEVRLLMVALALADEVKIEKIPAGIKLSCPGLDEGPTNLAYRAATLFFEETGVRGGARIAITKKIPVGGGLGGGSTDAAAVLEGLDRLYGSNLGPDRLRSLAGRLGSDVPFFIDRAGGSWAAWATGRGENIRPLPGGIPLMGVALVNPGFPVSTPEAYKSLGAPPFKPGRLTEAGEGSMDTPLPAPLWGTAGKAFLRNDLERAVFVRYPVLEEMKRALIEAGASVALMSGSGASVFGLCGSTEAAREVLHRARLPEGALRLATATIAAGAAE